MDRVKNKRSRLGVRQRNFILLGLIPICAAFFVFFILPIGYSMVMSLFNYSGFGNAPFVGMNNYKTLLQDKEFLGALKNTVIFVLAAANINIVAATMIAVLIKSVRRRRMKSFFRGWFFLPAVIPMVASSYVWSIMFQPSSGIINRFLVFFGLGPFNWLGERTLALPAVIVTTLWCDLGYNILLILAGLDEIPATFLEAASIDGAGSMQRFAKITLPLLSRNLVFVCISTYISYFQVFAQVQIMTKGGPDNATNVLGFNIYNYAFRYSQMGYASAMAMILMLIILVIAVIQYFCMKADWEY